MKTIIRHPLNGTKEDFDWFYLDTEINTTCPWYTIGALEFLNSITNLSELSVFEYGCGRSSAWWKRKTQKWNGVDSNKKWAEECDCLYRTDKVEYITSCLGFNYDIIVIDGIYRDDCTEFALSSINKNGYIVIDNWNQETADLPESSWTKSNSLLSKYKKNIFKEPLHIDWKTAIFEIK